MLNEHEATSRMKVICTYLFLKLIVLVSVAFFVWVTVTAPHGACDVGRAESRDAFRASALSATVTVWLRLSVRDLPLANRTEPTDQDQTDSPEITP